MSKRVLQLGALGSVIYSLVSVAAAEESVRIIDYRVVAGDSCGKIAKRQFGDSHRVDLIHQHNALGPVPHHLKAGQVLRIPESAVGSSREPDARLTYVRNQVEAYTPDYHQGKKDEPLAAGHRVGTLANSSAELTFVDETKMQLGEHSLIAIFGASADVSRRMRKEMEQSEATLLKGTLRAHLLDLAAPAAGASGAAASAASKQPVLVATPSGRVAIPRTGSEAKIDVDAQRSTRLSVLRGRSQLRASGKQVDVPEGFGSRADFGKAPTAPRPLPGVPVLTQTPPRLLLTKDESVTAEVAFAPSAAASGSPGAKVAETAQFHIQLARDAAFNDLLAETIQPAEQKRYVTPKLPEGELRLRVSAIDSDRFEGAATQVQVVRVVRVAQLPMDDSRKLRVRVPADLRCNFDDGPLQKFAEPISAEPSVPHQLRCTLPEGEGATDTRVATLSFPPVDPEPLAARSDSGPVQLKDGFAEQLVRLQLLRASGAKEQTTYRDLRLEAAPGVQTSAVTQPEPGSYQSLVRWPLATQDLGLRLYSGKLLLAQMQLPTVEPPPAELRLTPRSVVQQPQEQETSRLHYTLGVMGASFLNIDTYGFGGGVEPGLQVQLPFGRIGVSLRVLFEKHLQPEPAPFIVNVGLPISFVIARPHWRLQPYVTLWPQLMAQKVPESMLSSSFVRSEGGLLLGGQVGALLKLWKGGLFIEGGYRGAVLSSAAATVPAWNTGSVLLGYRLISGMP
jgi:hypothetical protein